MSLFWYIKRARTFTVPEIFFRFKQQFRQRVLDKRLFRNTPCKEKTAFVKSSIIEDPAKHYFYPIFSESLDLFKPIQWHLDLASGKTFPKIFSHSVDIRSDFYGSAKNVWEINRHLFLVHLALLYKKTQDKNYLDLIFYHLESFKNENPYLLGVNWYSNIEVNIRLIQWAYCFKILDMNTLLAKEENTKVFFENVWKPLITEHAEYSFKHPSFYSSANNHLISEYAGLFVATSVFEFLPKRKARNLYAKQGLEKEILKQNSEEGINKEEAAEYIQFINDFFLIAALFAKETKNEFSDTYYKRLKQMAFYLNNLLDKNGNYAMYGDGDDGFVLRTDKETYFNNFISQLNSFALLFKEPLLKRSGFLLDEKSKLLFGKNAEEDFQKLESLGDAEKSVFYRKSGHYIFRKRNADKEIYMHFNAAPLGFLSIAAHGHSDALSFLMHVDGYPIFIDSGTYTYHTEKEYRKYFVSALAHNTICVNQKNMADFVFPTMWLSHYQCKTLEANEEQEFVVATHNGYVKQGVTHTREIRFDKENNLFTIIDTLAGGKFNAEIPFHLHPDVFIEQTENGFLLKHPKVRNVYLETDRQLKYKMVCGQKEPLLGFYSEHFGHKEATNVLYARIKSSGTVRLVTKIKIMD